MTHPLLELHPGDARELIMEYDDDSVQCIITSPPYWGIHDYEADHQIGLEAELSCRVLTCERCYMCQIARLFHDLHGALAPTGLLWLNLGDRVVDGHMLGIPWRVCLMLETVGFTLVSDIVWNKYNSPVTDTRVRPSVIHEYIFMMCKTKDYYYDREALRVERMTRTYQHGRDKNNTREDHSGQRRIRHRKQNLHRDRTARLREANSIWGYGRGAGHKDVHRDALPPEMVKAMIEASTPYAGRCLGCGELKPKHPHLRALHDGRCRCDCIEASPCIVLDPFSGSGTVPIYAAQLGRHGIGFELNPDNLRASYDLSHEVFNGTRA